MDAIAESWFTHRALEDGVHLIEEPHVDIRVRPNIWLVIGRDAAMLVDSGMGVSPLAPEIARLTELPVHCVSTHCHFDHVGGAHEFESRLSHPSEASNLATPDRYNVTFDGWIDETTFHKYPHTEFDPRAYAIRPCPPTRPVDDGDVVDLGDRHFQVLHVPGHSPGSIALFEVATEILFSGDLIYQGDLLDDVYHSCPDDYRDSLERIKHMPVRTVHGGHYASFGRERLCEIADDYIAGHRKPGCPAGAA